MGAIASLLSRALKVESPWEIEKVEFVESLGRVNVVLDFPRGSLFPYPRCKKATAAYDTTQKQWRQMNLTTPAISWRGHCETIFVGAGKGMKTVSAFREDFVAHRGDPDKVTDVSMDMSSAFIRGMGTAFPRGEITFDKFHLMQILNEAVDAVRWRGHCGREESRAQDILRGQRYLF